VSYLVSFNNKSLNLRDFIEEDISQNYGCKHWKPEILDNSDVIIFWFWI